MNERYKAAEARLLREHALTVVTNPKAPLEDRNAARGRLMAPPDVKPDYNRLTEVELLELREALATVQRLGAKACDQLVEH